MMYELGISFAVVEVRSGAAPLWMVPTLRTGDADVQTAARTRHATFMMGASLPQQPLEDKEKGLKRDEENKYSAGRRGDANGDG